MGRIQGHDLHGDERRGELRAAENMHEHGSFHSGEAGKPCRDPKEERCEPGQKVPHMFAVVLAPGKASSRMISGVMADTNRKHAALTRWDSAK